jgi:hypothetical protein
MARRCGRAIRGGGSDGDSCDARQTFECPPIPLAETRRRFRSKRVMTGTHIRMMRAPVVFQTAIRGHGRMVIVYPPVAPRAKEVATTR